MGPTQGSKVHGAWRESGAGNHAPEKFCHPVAPEATSLEHCRANTTFGGFFIPPKEQNGVRSSGVEGSGLRSHKVAPTFLERGFRHPSQATGPVDLTSLDPKHENGCHLEGSPGGGNGARARECGPTALHEAGTAESESTALMAQVHRGGVERGAGPTGHRCFSAAFRPKALESSPATGPARLAPMFGPVNFGVQI